MPVVVWVVVVWVVMAGCGRVRVWASPSEVAVVEACQTLAPCLLPAVVLAAVLAVVLAAVLAVVLAAVLAVGAPS